jgi:hypothetical protein
VTGPAAAAHPVSSGIGVATVLTCAILVVLLAVRAALVVMAYRRGRHHKNHLGAHQEL